MLPDEVKADGEGATKAGGQPIHDIENRHFLLFGGDGSFVYDTMFDTGGARNYLRFHGFSTGSLTHMREQKDIALRYKGYSSPGERRCDFCGKRLTGVEYEVLRDGRDRCAECSATVVTGQDSLTSLFQETKKGLCTKFGIDFPAPISVRVTTAEQIAKNRGKTFVPTPGFDARSVGYATSYRGAYIIVLENETPRMSLVSTMAHELTHIWQYTHWDMNAIRAKYGRYSLAIIEGLAMWSETQYLYLINEGRRADDYLASSVMRKDEYGFGLRLYLKQYSISQSIVLEGKITFTNWSEPIDPSLITSA